jgi:tetratricopeptide (TPR) repeat protein
MKNVWFLTLILAFSFQFLSAQEYKKQLKNANKTLGKYYLEPAENMAALTEALATVEAVFETEEARIDADAWNTKGQIFNEIAAAEMIKYDMDSKLGGNYKLATPDAGVIARDAFNKAIETAIKKSQTKDALEGLKQTENHTNNIGIVFFQMQDWPQAYKNLNASYDIHKLLKNNDTPSRLSTEDALKDHVFYTAVAAYYGEKSAEAEKLFTQLYDMGSTESLVFEGLFTLIVEKDEAKAMEILEAGRKANPDDSGLLFAEINYYLKAGKLEVLTNKLKAAIAKEPDNVSVYTTLGNVYDQLNQQERQAGNDEQADNYFNEAFSYFNQALEKDEKNFDATYSLGALYYNKAAGMTSKLNELSNDFSSAGTKKYNALKAEMDGYFQKALPYFQKAEQLEPSDLNTMIALREIYARSGDLDKAAEYKEKIGSN